VGCAHGSWSYVTFAKSNIETKSRIGEEKGKYINKHLVLS
jgi:hypothetical protein